MKVEDRGAFSQDTANRINNAERTGSMRYLIPGTARTVPAETFQEEFDIRKALGVKSTEFWSAEVPTDPKERAKILKDYKAKLVEQAMNAKGLGLPLLPPISPDAPQGVEPAEASAPVIVVARSDQSALQ